MKNRPGVLARGGVIPGARKLSTWNGGTDKMWIMIKNQKRHLVLMLEGEIMQQPDYQIELTDQPSAEDTKAVERGLDAFNAEQGAPIHWQNLSVFVRNADSKVTGGLLGGTYWGWLYVNILWLDASLRGQGVGTQLMQRAEAEAARRGCHAVHLDTMDFQALGFYLKLGYQLYGQLDDFPIGHQRYYLFKTLSGPEV
jgi:GNAT superfamily N-acetyltransferase